MKQSHLKLWTLVLSVAVLLCGLLVYQKTHEKTISGLAEFLRHRGFSVIVNPPVSPEESAVLLSFNQATDALDQKGAMKKSDSETAHLVIDGIDVTIEQFPSSAEAKKKYDYAKKIEEGARVIDERKNIPHERWELFLNANLTMRIDYYKVNLADGKIVLGGDGFTPIDLNPKAVEAIRSAFMAN